MYSRGTPESSDGERSRNAQALPAQVGRARPQDARWASAKAPLLRGIEGRQALPRRAEETLQGHS